MNANFSGCFSSNLSTESVSEFVWSMEPIVHTDIATRYIITITCFILIILGIPWNSVVIAIIIRKKLYKAEPAIILLLNLGIADMLLCILVMPFNLVPGITKDFSFGSSDAVRCKVCQIGVVFIVLMLVLLNNFALMSIERLIYIRWALQYHCIVKPWKVTLVVLLSWLLCIICTLPPLFGFGEMQFSTAIGICTIKFSGSTPISRNTNYLVIMFIVIFIPIVVLVVTNFWVVCIAQKHLRNIYRQNKEKKGLAKNVFYQELKKKHTSVQINFIKIYMTIFITFIVTWTPTLVRLLAGMIAEDAEFTPGIRVGGTLAYIALLSQVVVHPALLAMLIREVKEALFKHVTAIKNDILRVDPSSIQLSRYSESNRTLNQI